MKFPDREFVSLAMVRKTARLVGKSEQDFRNAYPSAMEFRSKKGQLFVGSGTYEYAKTTMLKDWYEENS